MQMKFLCHSLCLPTNRVSEKYMYPTDLKMQAKVVGYNIRQNVLWDCA